MWLYYRARRRGPQQCSMVLGRSYKCQVGGDARAGCCCSMKSANGAVSARAVPCRHPAVLLPEAKSLRERSAAARKLADALRSALPNVRGEGRRRGAEQVRGSP